MQGSRQNKPINGAYSLRSAGLKHQCVADRRLRTEKRLTDCDSAASQETKRGSKSNLSPSVTSVLMSLVVHL